MQTAIFVYQTTDVTISTNETNLEMCSMDNETVPLSHGANTRSVPPGIYKIVSSQNVQVSGGNTSAFETTTTNSKTSVPTLPVKATQSFGSTYINAFPAFFATPDAKELGRAP
jgi:hypothetical protein